MHLIYLTVNNMNSINNNQLIRNYLLTKVAGIEIKLRLIFGIYLSSLKIILWHLYLKLLKRRT